MAHTERILIVGGGIAGLTLAAALDQHGFTPEIIERNASWHAVGAGIAVQPNGIRVLRTLGMGEAIEQAGTVICEWDFCNQQGEVLCAIDLQALWKEVGPFVGIERIKLHRVLRERTARIPFRLNTTITALIQNKREVRVEFNDGSTGVYDLVVGADGIDSTVRKLTLDASLPLYTGQMVWRSVAPIQPLGPGKLQFFLGDGCFFGLCPVGAGQAYGFGNMTEPRSYDALQGRLDRLRERFATFGQPVQDYLAALSYDDEIHVSPIDWVELETWHTGRVVLIGDAAHASIPMMGQGGCLAMEDAWVLAEVLASTGDVERALDAYVVRRGPRVGWVQQQSRAVAESFHLSPAARDAMLRQKGDQFMHARFEPLIPTP